mmetsp:Transcript_3035/g.7398  ORF Transcript_3035/g.7398 Transcript_3035/m.7398 type:complete len:748 (-) Transcript_3035:4-2247(-)
MMNVPEHASQEVASGAIKRVAELLAVPDDLLRVPDLRLALLKESSQLKAKLKADVHTQLQQARAGLAALQQSSTLVSQVQSSFRSVDTSCTHCQQLFGDHYELIREVDRARRNLYITRRVAMRLLEIPNAVREIRIDLQDDRKLLDVHKKIRQLENARHAVLLQVWDHEREVGILCEKFRIVDSLSEQFELRLWAIVENSLELSQSHPWAIVKVLQIVEREELADQQAFALSRGIARQGGEFSHFSSDARQSQPKQLIRGYQGICLKTLQASIASRFESAMPGMLSELNAVVPAKGEEAPDEVARVLQVLRRRLAELQLIKEHLVPCFPPRYDSWNFFVREYRRHIALVLESFSAQANDLIPRQILSIVQWVPCICERYLQRMGASDAGPPLIELLSNLMDIYQNSIKSLLMDWAGRIVTTDKKQQPLEDRTGLYYTDAPSNLFQFINQQLNFVELTLYQPFISGVLQECCRVLTNFQMTFMELLKNSWVSLSYPYLLACINNFHSCRARTESLTDRARELLDAELVEDLCLVEIGKSLERVCDRASWAAEQVIFRDVEPALRKLFTKEWQTEEDNPIMEAIVDTLEDYFTNDTEGCIAQADLLELKKRCIDRLVASYISEMLTRKNQFKKKSTPRFQTDLRLIRKLASSCFGKQTGDTMVMILLNLVSIVVLEDFTGVSQHVESLVTRNKDFSVDAIESLLGMCKHHKKSFVKKVLQHANTLVQRDSRGQASNYYNPTYPYFTQRL